MNLVFHSFRAVGLEGSWKQVCKPGKSLPLTTMCDRTTDLAWGQLLVQQRSLGYWATVMAL